MTQSVRSDLANLLLASLCLLSLVLSGGFVSGVATADELSFGVDIEAGPPIGPPIPFTTQSDGDGNGSGSGQSTATATGTPETESGRGGTVPSTPTPTRTSTATPTQHAAELGSQLRWAVVPFIVGLLLLLAGGVAIAWRRETIASPRDVLGHPAVALDWLLAVLVEFATTGATGLRRLWAVLGRATTTVRTIAMQVLVPASEPAADRTLTARLAAAVRGLFAVLAAVVRNPGDSVGNRPTGTPPDDSGQTSGDTRASARAPSPQASSDEFEIDTAWGWLARQTEATSAGPRTPGEIARDAIEAGYPAEAVLDLLQAFRDVTYGEHPPTAERRAAAERAYERLRTPQNTGGSGE